MPLVIHAVPGDDIVPQKPSLDDGDFWGGTILGIGLAVAATVLPATAVFASDEDLPTPPAAASIVEEDYAQVAVLPTQYLYVQPFLDDDIIVQQSVVGTIVDEDFWNAPPPAMQGLSAPAFLDTEDLPVFVAASPIVEEDVWTAPTPSSPWLSLAFRDTDDIVPQPAPGQPDEDLWTLGPPPVAASIYMRLPYLPDPEEIPAGSLVPPTPPSTRVYTIFVFDD